MSPLNYYISLHAIQHKHQPTTPNTTRNIIIYISPYTFISHTKYFISQSIKIHIWTWNQSSKSKNIQIAHTQMGYIASNISQHTFQAKHRPRTPNRTDTVIFFTHPCALLLIPNTSDISTNEKSHVKIKSKLKIKKYSNRSQTNDIYHF